MMSRTALICRFEVSFSSSFNRGCTRTDFDRRVRVETVGPWILIAQTDAIRNIRRAKVIGAGKNQTSWIPLGGFAVTDDSPTSGPVIEGLKRRGWIEGTTILFERRAANGEISRLPSLVSELVADRVEAILTSSLPAVAACKGASVPAIASGAGDLVSLGLVDSFRHPGGNITGISDLAGELAPKRLAILKETLLARADEVIE
jgi:ABC transporter substrate binding protein